MQHFQSNSRLADDTCRYSGRRTGRAKELEVSDGIHLISRVRGANAYLVESEESVTVVDTGLPGNAGKILDYVEKAGWHRSDVRMIILTHSDVDHVGSAARLRKETGAKIAIHEADAPKVSGEEPWRTAKGVLGLVFRLIGLLMRFNRFRADVLVRHSDVFDGLIVVHTPGHTEGSICLYIPGRALFVGDTLLTNHERMLSLPRKSVSGDLNVAKDSIRKLSQLDYSTLLPGHGPSIEQNASVVVREFIAHF